MATVVERSTTSTTVNHRQPSRLQRRAPASIKINPMPDWNIAIPLLSPLTSPVDRTVEMKSRSDPKQEQQSAPEQVIPPVFKKWQHPAAPFCYEPVAPFMASFFRCVD